MGEYLRERPDLLEEVHPTLNSDLKMYGKPEAPGNLKINSNKKLFWLCKKCNHVWKTSVSHRNNGTGCGHCRRGDLHSDGRNSMRNTRPEWVQEFHLTKNGSVTPDNVVAGTMKRIFWNCTSCAYEWEIDGDSRNQFNTGCPKCAGTLKRTQEEFEALFREIHGGKYSLENAVYLNDSTKIEVVCPIHGPWSTSPSSLLHQKTGCKRCAMKIAAASRIGPYRKNSISDWIERFQNAHGEKYDYTELPADASSAREKVWINCPDHGRFQQSLSDHASGNGCNQCGIMKRTEGLRTSKSEIISRCLSVHNERYSYPWEEIDYQNARQLMPIICPDHGTFHQTMINHMYSANGCPDCGVLRGADSRRLTTSQFIERAKAVHGNKYDYSKTEYGQTQDDKVVIICPTHGNFLQMPVSHMQGKGCASCAPVGFQPSQSGYYYVNAILNEDEDVIAYKGGISGDWERRFKQLQKGLPNHLKLRHVEYQWFERGYDAQELETTLLRVARQEGWKAPQRDFDGGNELFIINPLERYREIIATL
ncbi:zinc-ribbon domain-containing protein [Candidatus Poseidoniales archaeon]|nr:zinc-ribbon domain-containing protein [Candidatus Poseidoniales archaeon]